MTFARITLDYAIELVTARIENGQGSPTDGEIASYCGIDEPSHVRSLLADLADAGRITIRGTGADRQITLGRAPRAPLVPAMPSTALARKTSREVDSAVKRIGDIVRRKPRDIAEEVAAEPHASSSRRVAAARAGTTIRPFDKAAAAPVVKSADPVAVLPNPVVKTPPISHPVARVAPLPETPVSPPAIPPGAGDEEAQRDGSPSPTVAAPQPVSPPVPDPKQGDGEGAQARGSLRDGPAPQALEPLPPVVIAQLSKKGQRDILREQAVEPKRTPLPAPKLEMVRLPTKGGTKRNRQLTFTVTGDMLGALDARAKRSGQSRAWEAFSLLGEALEGKIAAPPAKVRVPAHITAAAAREGVPVIAFVADLLERGFREWSGDWSLERCA